MRLAPLALAVTLPLALPVAAQTARGSITGTLDLDAANYTIVQSDEVPSSGWREVDEGYEVTIVGYPDVAPLSPEDAITITFTVDGGAVEPAAENASVSLASSGDETLQASGENIDFSLTAFEVDGADIAIAGNAVATMTPGGSDDLVISGENDVIFDGNFQGTIPRAE